MANFLKALRDLLAFERGPQHSHTCQCTPELHQLLQDRSYQPPETTTNKRRWISGRLCCCYKQTSLPSKSSFSLSACPICRTISPRFGPGTCIKNKQLIVDENKNQFKTSLHIFQASRDLSSTSLNSCTVPYSACTVHVLMHTSLLANTCCTRAIGFPLAGEYDVITYYRRRSVSC